MGPLNIRLEATPDGASRLYLGIGPAWRRLSFGHAVAWWRK
jgi:hypothetical protein